MDTNPGHVFAIELPGIPESLRPLAERDIKGMVDSISRIISSADLPHLLRLVRITNSFQADVNQFQKEFLGLSGYVAVRANVHAIARTCLVRSENEGLAFAVVIDADHIRPWNSSNPRCLATVFHELFHVLFETHYLEIMGPDEYLAADDTKARLLARKARLLIDEFQADIKVDQVISAFFQKEDGQPLSLRELDEATGVYWGYALMERLIEMPLFIDERVQALRIGQTGIEDFYNELVPYVIDTLTLLVHTAGSYLKTDQWQVLLDSFRETEACRRFMKGHLDAILVHLVDSEFLSYVQVPSLMNAVEGIFLNCGIGFKTMPEGLYVSVTRPSV